MWVEITHKIEVEYIDAKSKSMIVNTDSTSPLTMGFKKVVDNLVQSKRLFQKQPNLRRAYKKVRGLRSLRWSA